MYKKTVCFVTFEKICKNRPIQNNPSLFGLNVCMPLVFSKIITNSCMIIEADNNTNNIRQLKLKVAKYEFDN